ncbi:hypothetical protein SprV_0200840000 [Sparganum proliferum]
MQLRWSGHLVRMDDERLPKRLFYGDVATGSRRQGGQIRRYKYTLKSSLKRLQINSTNWEELALDRPTWRRTVKRGAAIYEANCIAVAKEIFGSTAPLELHQPSPPPASSSSSLPPTNSDISSELPLPSFLPSSSSSSSTSSSSSSSSSSFSYSSSSSSSSSSALATAALAAVTNISITHIPDNNLRHHPSNLRLQRRGPGLHLPSLRPHLHPTHQPGRSLANPSHTDWPTVAWSTNPHPPYSPPLPSLPSHLHASHGPIRPHAHPRERN